MQAECLARVSRWGETPQTWASFAPQARNRAR
jgi:hypothetical protein